jgi:diguanylate cyclase (GGDEF)-like protein
MGRRKLIGLLLPNPEGVYQQRIMDGIFSQCALYGYDCAVFSPLVQVCLYYQDYFKGEKAIFNIINFDRLDGLIVPTITLCEDQQYEVHDYLLEKIKRECRKPVVAIDVPFGDYEYTETDDRKAFTVIAEHIVDTHKCDPSKVYFLTGPENHNVAAKRLNGFTDYYDAHGLTFPKENIFYGDFWYSGGENLAERIFSGELPMPQAVVCASDHMAIGVANRLTEHGIKVPEQVIVTGYDATPEAALNELTITTYVPDVSAAAADAVNRIHDIIEPDVPRQTHSGFSGSGLTACASCGCSENVDYVKQRLGDSLYHANHNYVNGELMDGIDIGVLLESYMLENITSSNGVQDFLSKILKNEYLIRPYDKFYICLNENWLDSSQLNDKDYTERIRTVIISDSEYCKLGDWSGNFIGNTSEHEFDISEMLPELNEERDEPAVFYFVPLHFASKPLGYAVIQCSATQKHKINIVFRNWVRNINNGLEMVKAQEELRKFSERDSMTGLNNRRGMETWLNEKRISAKEGDNVIVFVVDMDGLKAINDTYGHNEGDYGINAIAAAVRSVTRNNEICVRAGGDEFYIIGIGEYSGIDAIIRTERLNLSVSEVNKSAGKPYEISASVGCSLQKYEPEKGIEATIQDADEKMYNNKVMRKKHRTN